MSRNCECCASLICSQRNKDHNLEKDLSWLWHPIAKAPKDGTELILYSDKYGGQYWFGRWIAAEEAFCTQGGEHISDAIAYMHIPEVPPDIDIYSFVLEKLFMQKIDEVAAIRWCKNGDYPLDACTWIEDSGGRFLSEGKVVRYYRHPDVAGFSKCSICGKIMHLHGWIDTPPEGLTVCPGDWIVPVDGYKVFAPEKFVEWVAPVKELMTQTEELFKELNLPWDAIRCSTMLDTMLSQTSFSRRPDLIDRFEHMDSDLAITTGGLVCPCKSKLTVTDNAGTVLDGTVLYMQVLKEYPWRPISSAPRDGTEFIVLFNKDRVEVAWFHEKEELRCKTGIIYLSEVRAWMPIPEWPDTMPWEQK